jgi:tRNA (cytidine32/uridine32-2'-O)-methyltransferase
LLNNIRIVLVRTFHSGNIGSAARAMKTMGLSDLYLVNLKEFQADQALQMAMSADDVVKNAQTVDNLYDAVKDCSIVIASTARTRGFDLPMLNPEQAAQYSLASVNSNEKAAIVFGPERMGLSNEDLQVCTHRVTIPTNPDYSSLNLAAAVQTVCYEIYKQAVEFNLVSTLYADSDHRELPSIENLERFYSHLEETLANTGFIIKNHPGEVMQKLRTLFARAELDESELNILRGLLASIQRDK